MRCVPPAFYELTSPWYGRSHLLARRLDDIYEGKTFFRPSGASEPSPSAGDSHRPVLGDLLRVHFRAIRTHLFGPRIRPAILRRRRIVACADPAVAASSAVPILLSPMTLKNYAQECRERGVQPRAAAGSDGDFRARMFWMQASSYLNAERRPFIHLVDGGVADNLAVRRLLDRALIEGALAKRGDIARVVKGGVHKLIVISVNSGRDPSNNVDASDRLPGVRAVADALLFGAGARASTERRSS